MNHLDVVRLLRDTRAAGELDRSRLGGWQLGWGWCEPGDGPNTLPFGYHPVAVDR